MFQRLESLFYMVVVLSATFVSTTGNDLKEEDRRAHSDRRGLWFGPRLGKRSAQMLDEDNRDIYYRLIDAADALKYYYDQLPGSYLERRNEPETRVTKKVIFTPKLGRSLGSQQESQFADFTPRLGRRLAEDMAVTPPNQEIYQPDSDRVGTRTRYFSPRLGRTMSFSPRLGRELSYDNYPDRVRVARSANDTKTSKR